MYNDLLIYNLFFCQKCDLCEENLEAENCSHRFVNLKYLVNFGQLGIICRLCHYRLFRVQSSSIVSETKNSLYFSMYCMQSELDGMCVP